MLRVIEIMFDVNAREKSSHPITFYKIFSTHNSAIFPALFLIFSRKFPSINVSTARTNALINDSRFLYTRTVQNRCNMQTTFDFEKNLFPRI